MQLIHIAAPLNLKFIVIVDSSIQSAILSL